MCLEVGPRYRCAHEETQQEWLHLDTEMTKLLLSSGGLQNLAHIHVQLLLGT